MTSWPWTKRIFPTLCLVAVHIAALGAPADAQSRSYVVVEGRILDATTVTPVHGAFVAPRGSDTGFLTDSTGVFRLELLPDRVYLLRVEQLGYQTTTVELPETAPDEFSIIKIRPDPIALEGLRVLVDGFEYRRRRYFGSVRVIDGERLQRAAVGSGYDLVVRNTPFARICFRDPMELCTRGRRGRGDQQVLVCIDEVRAWGSVPYLQSFSANEFYLVEVYGRGTQVRLYTRWWIENRARNFRFLKPLDWGC